MIWLSAIVRFEMSQRCQLQSSPTKACVLTFRTRRDVHAGRVHLLQSAIAVQILCEALQRICRTAIRSAHKSSKRHCNDDCCVGWKCAGEQRVRGHIRIERGSSEAGPVHVITPDGRNPRKLLFTIPVNSIILLLSATQRRATLTPITSSLPSVS